MAILYIFHAETSTGQNYECNRHDYICYRQELYTFRHALITLLKPPPGKSRNLKKDRFKYVIFSACNSEIWKKRKPG